MLESPWARAQTIVIRGGSPVDVFYPRYPEIPTWRGRTKQASDKCCAGDSPERIGSEAMRPEDLESIVHEL